jgi:hypothetical protein
VRALAVLVFTTLALTGAATAAPRKILVMRVDGQRAQLQLRSVR